MIKIYGMPTCPDCVRVLDQIRDKKDRYTFIDIGSDVRYMKEFIRFRDTDPAFAECRSKADGTIGIPAFLLEDGRISLDPEDAGLDGVMEAEPDGTVSNGEAATELGGVNSAAAAAEPGGIISPATAKFPSTSPAQSERPGKPVSMKLRLDLVMDDLDDKDMEILRKYGKVQNSISRTVIVPGTMTLHALHYAINQAFGWQNSHLHNFALPAKTEMVMTDGHNLARWSDLCGIYFRFPSEQADTFWDDDYQQGENPKVWMRRKYRGPYKYPGFSEHYRFCQNEVSILKSRYPEVDVYETFAEMWERRQAEGEGKNNSKNGSKSEGPLYKGRKAFHDAMTDELETDVSFETSFYELLERLTVADLMRPWISSDSFETRSWDFYDSHLDWPGLVKCWNGMGDIFSLDAQMGFNRIETEYTQLYARFLHTRRKSKKLTQAAGPYREMVEQTDLSPVPVTSELLYSYDYGDNWQVRITCEEVYFEEDAASDEQLRLVSEKERPVCIAADGLSLMDDCGGIYGYIRDLQTMKDPSWLARLAETGGKPDITEDPEYVSMWTKSMGWTGRAVKPGNLL